MGSRYTLIAFTGVLKDSGRNYPDEAPFTVQRSHLTEDERTAYEFVIGLVRNYGFEQRRIEPDAALGILDHGRGHFPSEHSDPTRTVCGRYAVVRSQVGTSGILVLFIQSRLRGDRTIEMIGLRRFKTFSDGSPDFGTISPVVPSRPDPPQDGF